jgi:hypothetical protein
MQKHNEVRKEETSKQEAEKTALDQLLLKVAQDAQTRPEAYLQETIVPEGGE